MTEIFDDWIKTQSHLPKKIGELLVFFKLFLRAFLFVI